MDKTKQDRLDLIKLTVEDLVILLLDEQRVGDDELPPGEIEDAIADGDLTTDDMAAWFLAALKEALS
jgi:hypothetical protein